MAQQQVKETIEEGEALKMIAESFSEVAFVKLQRIRGDVEQTRTYFTELTDMYGLIRRIALQKKILTSLKSKKTVSILLTSNYRFNGSIDLQLIRFFINHTIHPATDKMIIGKTGIEYFTSTHTLDHFKPLQFKRDLPSEEELNILIQEISEYEQVYVYFSQFRTVLTQIPTRIDITQSISEQSSLSLPEKPSDFIFEPEINKMLEFFDNQIKLLLLERTFLESELARTASRMIAMDQAQNNAKEFIKKRRSLLAQALRSVNNLRVLEMANFRAGQKKTSRIS